MRWQVQGADRETGVKRALVIDAPSRNDAEVKARAEGLLIASIAPAPATERIDGPSPTTGVPRYAGLELASLLLLLCAVLNYVGAAGLIVAAILRLGAPEIAVSALLLALAQAGFGAMLHGAGSACGALRDIARNSFRG